MWTSAPERAWKVSIVASQHDNVGDPGRPIIVCYDGSPGATRALQSAATLMHEFPAIVLYVQPRLDTARIHTTSVKSARPELIEEVRIAARHEGQAVAETGAMLAAEAGLKARPLTVEATQSTADTIINVAKEESAAAVVIGRAGRTSLGPLLLDSVTRSVVDRCSTPVLVA